VSVEQWIGVAMILGGFGWGFYLVLHPELSLTGVREPITSGPITFETTNGGTHGDLQRRLASSACVWCSAGPREAHTDNCPYVP
jgi:hypothetical protein